MHLCAAGSRILLFTSMLTLSIPLAHAAQEHAPAQPDPGRSGSDGQTAASSERPVPLDWQAWADEKLASRARAAEAGRHSRRYASRSLQCVPYARSHSGIELKGNASLWWNEAAGLYQRGNRPEPGSVLSFASNKQMRLGHVAVVARVINPREIEIDHANWGIRGAVSKDVPVVDVSENNDWTAVRVGMSHPGEFGDIYPTHGFIYDRPDDGTMVASNAVPAPKPELKPAPRDLRLASSGITDPIPYEEVAELAEHRSAHGRSYHRSHHKYLDLSLASH
jgi:surface antigen